MDYLTTHDLVWINSTITGRVNAYSYVTLEAAMAGQYSYGQSTDVPAQAATLLERLIQARPFAEGNVRTAFIATLTFLNGNGYATCLDDAEAAELIRAVGAGHKSAAQAIAELAAPAGDPLASTLTLRKLISHECNHHQKALAMLAEND